MRIDCIEQVELPFILNIPSGNYQVGGLGDTYLLLVSQEQLAAHFENNGFAIGSESDIRHQLGEQHNILHWQQLRTLVIHTSSLELSEDDLPLLSEDKLHEVMQGKIIGEAPMLFAGKTEELQNEARRRLSALNEEEKSVFRRRASIKAVGRTLADADAFVTHLNLLIRLYMAKFHDHFVEEVTLHQLSSQSPLRGVFTTVVFEDEPVGFYGHVGKAPPFMYRPWQNHSAEKVKEFRTLLESGQQPDAIDLMAVRSRNCLEKGAYRSAIVEASAALDLGLSSKIREGLRYSGMSDTDIDEMLRKPQNQRFDERAKTILKNATGQTVPALNNTLWSAVSTHRTVIRQGVTHSSAEPDKDESQKVVDDFLRLAALIKAIPVGTT